MGEEDDICFAVADEHCEKLGLVQRNDNSPEDAAWEREWNARKERCWKERTDGALIMQRTIAARAYLNGVASRDTRENRRLEMSAFLSIFHPELTEEERRTWIANVQ